MVGRRSARQTRRVNAQRIATGVGIAALLALFLGVGLPTLLPPSPVAEIEIESPTDPEPTLPPMRLDDGDGDEDGDDGDDEDDAVDSVDTPDDDWSDSADSPDDDH